MEALNQDDSQKWDGAIRSELISLENHSTWEVVKRPENARVIPTRLVFKRKFNEDGSVSRHKARMVVKGFMQGPIEDTYAPVVYFTSVRIAIAIAVQKGLKLHQLDIRTAFFHGKINGTVFVSPPAGLEHMGLKICSETDVLLLKKGLYGLKQAPKLWNMKWLTIMNVLQFEPLRADPCTCRRKEIWLLIYVDDFIVIARRKKDINQLINDLKRHLDFKDLGRLRHFLGTSFTVDAHGDWLSQKHYVTNILQRFGMQKCKPANTPMCLEGNSMKQSESVNQTLYREMIGALLFLSTRTRTDISSAVKILECHRSDPRKDNLVAVKRVSRYLKGTVGFALRISSSGGSLVGFADADWGGDKQDSKSTSGFIIQLAGTSISWRTSKQKIVALSTTEAECVSASDLCNEIVWVRHLLKEMEAEVTSSTILFEDNQCAIRWAQEGVRNAKHIYIRKNYLLEQVQPGIVKLVYCSGKTMTGDIFTNHSFVSLSNVTVRASVSLTLMNEKGN